MRASAAPLVRWMEIASRIRVLPNGCWEWTGSRTPVPRGSRGPGGYGRWGKRLAHRVIYEMCVGPIPRGLTLDHKCRMHACVNWAHLEPVTQAENNRRAAR